MRYVLHPGYIRSKHDGDEHYIGVFDLVRLYKVDPRKCVDSSKPGLTEQPGDVHLHPRYDGDYSLPQAGEGQP